MSHFAEINNNIVVRVLVCDNNDPNGDEGYQWLIDNFGGTWVKTSYNNKIRKQFAGVGYIYDSINDVFICPQPLPSWVLDGNFDWQPPIEKPDNQKEYYWDEPTISWIEK